MNYEREEEADEWAQICEVQNPFSWNMQNAQEVLVSITCKIAGKSVGLQLKGVILSTKKQQIQLHDRRTAEDPPSQENIET